MIHTTHFRTFALIQYYFDHHRASDSNELWGVQSMDALPQFVNWSKRIDTLKDLNEKLHR